MRRHIWKLALMCAAVTCAVVSTAAFGFYAAHKPTPAEQKAITKYADNMNKVLDQFRSPDWDEKIDVAYVLFFSNGRRGRWEEVNDVYRNFFVHKPDTPFIENV